MENPVLKSEVILKFLVASFIYSFFIFAFADEAMAAGASLSIFPQSGSFAAGSTFDVSVFVNTGGNNINVVQVDLQFNPGKLQVITPAKGLSLVSQWIFPPNFSNEKGTVTLQGGFPSAGINTSEGLITIVVFKAVSPGKTEVNFLETSKVLLGEAKGNNILSSVNRAVFDIVPAPQAGPQIFSETHPDQNRWYKSSNPSFYWREDEGAAGYSYEIDDNPYGEPDNVVDTNSNSVSFENIAEGIQYFHLKAKRGQTWGGTSHFKLMIDKTPPSEFSPYLESFVPAQPNNYLLYFNTADLLSGIDYYEIRIADVSDPKNVIFSGWTQTESPYRLATAKSRVLEILIRAFDKAGNFKEGKLRVRIINQFLVLVSGGIRVNGVFLSWPIIYLLIIVVLLASGYFFLRWLRKRGEGADVRLLKEIKEAEKEIEDVKLAEEKLRRIRISEEKAREEYERLRESLNEEIKKTDK